MKISYLFLFLILGFSAFGQVPLIDASCCAEDNSMSPDSCLLFRYNDQNLVDIELKQVEGVNTERFLFGYTEDNLIEAIQFQEFENGDWAPKTLQQFSYDDAGNKIAELDRIFENGDWVNVKQTLWTYSDTENPNFPTIITNRTWDGTEWNFIDRNLFEYGDGNLVSNRYQNYVQGDWENVNVFSNNFDEKGNITASLFRQWVNGEWQNVSQTVSNFDDETAPNSPTIVANRIWDTVSQSWVFTTRQLFAYEDGNTISVRTQSFANGVWENLTLVATNYDANGNKTAELDRVWVNGDWVNVNQTLWNYNADNMVTAIVFKEGADLENNTQTLYTYNDDNTIVTNRVWENGAWQNVNRDITFFGTEDEIVLERVQEFTDGAWVTTSDCWSNFTLILLDADMDGFTNDVDCDDMNADINPDAEEIPNNGIDEDCDGLDGMFADADMDGFTSDVDCDDDNAEINPDAEEIPQNGIDEDCDGEDGAFLDVDMDGFTSDVDCDDDNADINPDAEEIPDNGIDEDCDGEDLMTATIDINESDLFAVYPNPTNGILRLENKTNVNSNYVIYNIDGKEAVRGSIINSIENIDISNLNSGVYILNITEKKSGDNYNTKIIKL